MDIKKAEDQIDKADSFLDKLWKFLGKHWGKLLIIGICILIYKFCVLVGEEMERDLENAAQEQVISYPDTDTSYVYDSLTPEEELYEK